MLVWAEDASVAARLAAASLSESGEEWAAEALPERYQAVVSASKPLNACVETRLTLLRALGFALEGERPCIKCGRYPVGMSRYVPCTSCGWCPGCGHAHGCDA